MWGGGMRGKRGNDVIMWFCQFKILSADVSKLNVCFVFC